MEKFNCVGEHLSHPISYVHIANWGNFWDYCESKALIIKSFAYLFYCLCLPPANIDSYELDTFSYDAACDAACRLFFFFCSFDGEKLWKTTKKWVRAKWMCFPHMRVFSCFSSKRKVIVSRMKNDEETFGEFSSRSCSLIRKWMSTLKTKKSFFSFLNLSRVDSQKYKTQFSKNLFCHISLGINFKQIVPFHSFISQLRLDFTLNLTFHQSF